jgi:transaldolase
MIEKVAKEIDIYADIQNVEQIQEYTKFSWVKGFTSNPTLVRKGGSKSYIDFIKLAVHATNNLPISIEVIADDFLEMERQAKFLHNISKNLIVKIPISNTKSESSIPLIKKLLTDGVPINVTAVFTSTQIKSIRQIVKYDSNCIVSVFAGRIADTGIDPVPAMKEYKNMFSDLPNVKLLWASPREILNLYHAIESNSDIITATPDILSKFSLLGKNLEDYSLETVQMFYNDARAANFSFEH